MNSDVLPLKLLFNDELLTEAKRLVACERAGNRRVAALVDGDRRAPSISAGEGSSSLFTYCTQVLHLAEGAAYNQIEAAQHRERVTL